MGITAGQTAELSEQLLSDMARQRHEVLFGVQGWDRQFGGGQALDEFDRPDTVYVVGQDEAGKPNGCVRLLPTIRPYPLASTLPGLLNGMPAPCSPEVWELSRLSAVDFNARTAAALSQYSSETAVKLLKAALATAACLGAKQVITVAPVGVERLLRRAGILARRSGPPLIVDGHPLFACWIALDSDAG